MITNCFKLFSLFTTLQLHCSCVAILIFEQAKDFQRDKKKPYVEGLTPTDWYKSFESQGRCPGVKCMWTMLHIKYVDTHEDQFSVYTKAPSKQTLACNYQEAGLHYSGKAQGVSIQAKERHANGAL